VNNTRAPRARLTSARLRRTIYRALRHLSADSGSHPHVKVRQSDHRHEGFLNHVFSKLKLMQQRQHRVIGGMLKAASQLDEKP
jgi:hypothetical protein